MRHYKRAHPEQARKQDELSIQGVPKEEGIIVLKALRFDKILPRQRAGTLEKAGLHLKYTIFRCRAVRMIFSASRLLLYWNDRTAVRDFIS